MTESAAAPRVDVLIAGAGPTGLVLAAQLEAFGASVAVVDTKAHPVAESRALAVQPRTLEVLRGSVTGRLLERGNPWHTGTGTWSGTPDGHVAYRSEDADLTGAVAMLARWLTG